MVVDRLRLLGATASSTTGWTSRWAPAPTVTAWAGYQVVAEYVDHYAPVRAKQYQAVARATRLLTTTEPTRLKQDAWMAATATV